MTLNESVGKQWYNQFQYRAPVKEQVPIGMVFVSQTLLRGTPIFCVVTKTEFHTPKKTEELVCTLHLHQLEMHFDNEGYTPNWDKSQVFGKFVCMLHKRDVPASTTICIGEEKRSVCWDDMPHFIAFGTHFEPWDGLPVGGSDNKTSIRNTIRSQTILVLESLMELCALMGTFPGKPIPMDLKKAILCFSMQIQYENQINLPLDANANGWQKLGLLAATIRRWIDLPTSVPNWFGLIDSLTRLDHILTRLNQMSAVL